MPPSLLPDASASPSVTHSAVPSVAIRVAPPLLPCPCSFVCSSFDSVAPLACLSATPSTLLCYTFLRPPARCSPFRCFIADAIRHSYTCSPNHQRAFSSFVNSSSQSASNPPNGSAHPPALRSAARCSRCVAGIVFDSITEAGCHSSPPTRSQQQVLSFLLPVCFSFFFFNP